MDRKREQIDYLFIRFFSILKDVFRVCGRFESKETVEATKHVDRKDVINRYEIRPHLNSMNSRFLVGIFGELQ